MSKQTEDTIACILDGCRGIYLPQAFAECFDCDAWGVSAENQEILLEGPDHDEYWDAWDEVIQTARYTDDAGYGWYLYQDGDLFACRDDYEEADEW